jgi:hypothetical protein
MATLARIESIWLEEGAAISSVNLGEVLCIRIRQDGEESAPPPSTRSAASSR